MRADRDVNELTGRDHIGVNVRVGCNDGVESHVEVPSNDGESLAAAHVVAATDTIDANSSGSVGGWKTGGVVRRRALGRDAEDLPNLDEVGVLDFVQAGNVANTRRIVAGDERQSLICGDHVINDETGATWGRGRGLTCMFVNI